MNQVLGGPIYLPETQQSRADRVSRRKPFMMRVLRMVVATTVVKSRFSGILLWELSGLFGIYNPKAPPFSASAGTSLSTVLTREKD